MKACTLMYTRNYKQEALCYIQETVIARKEITMFLVFLRQKDKLEQMQMLQGQIVND